MPLDNNKDLAFEDNFPDENEKESVFHYKRWICFSFVAVFIFVLLFINALLQRNFVIAHLKKQIAFSIESLNQVGWDVAYDNISFGSFPLSDLLQVKNLKIYNPQTSVSWNCSDLSINNSVIFPEKLQIKFSEKTFLSTSQKTYNISLPYQDVFLTLDEGKLQNFSAEFINLAIQDFADIEEWNFAAEIHYPTFSQQLAPSLKTVLEVKNIKLNGLLNYPLSQNIKKIYFSNRFIGHLNFENGFLSGIREWLAKDGYVEIDDFSLNWPPMLLVGKGKILLNENFEPIVSLNTTSLALERLIDDLEQKNWLDNKGVFVAKILLANKSYKSSENDKYLTVTTPITLQDDALLIEKIVIKKFN